MIRSVMAFTLLLAWAVWADHAHARDQYPIVFDSVQKLKRYGIALIGIGSDDRSLHFRTRCYYYGDGGWDLSVSDQFLEFYKSVGFSRRSACLALISGVRFNPETGKRLATYVLIDRKLLKSRNNEPSAASIELPLSLPACFAGGTPYSDCKWNFDPLTGKKLSANSPVHSDRRLGCRGDAKLKRFCGNPWSYGEAARHVEAFLSKPNSECASSVVSSKEPDRQFITGMITGQCSFVAEYDPSPDALENALIAWNTGASLYDYSSEFPKGYGYALYADGGAGPSASPASVAAALNGQKPQSQLDPIKLREIWGTGAVKLPGSTRSSSAASKPQ